MRFAYYIDQRVDWSATDRKRSEVIAAWMAITDSDLDVALRWWEAGADPLLAPEITELMRSGLDPRDLSKVVSGKSILEHLRDGTPVEWCLSALHWERPR